ncbi:MAG: hypothetical protein K2L83_03460, partial [Muribaculaceae bacterium]|nr:hypothetical protein [Muribaculaceae bacterium]
LPPLHDSNEGFIIPTSSPDEFYILENRQQSGYDTYIPGHGMLAWHIDFQQDIWDKNVVNNTRMHQYVDIVEADNKLTEVTRDGDTFPGTSGRTSFGYTTAPSLKSWAGAQLSVAMISEITESEEGVISFNATLSESGVASLEADATTRFVEIEGCRITNIGTQNCDIFSAGGARICSIAPGASTSLTAGLYIATSNGAAAKILL